MLVVLVIIVTIHHTGCGGILKQPGGIFRSVFTDMEAGETGEVYNVLEEMGRAGQGRHERDHPGSQGPGGRSPRIS